MGAVLRIPIRSEPVGKRKKSIRRPSNSVLFATIVCAATCRWNETQEHVLCDCTESHLVSLRDRFRAEATALFGEARSVALARAAGCSAVAPDLTNVTALLTVMRLCISVGAEPITTTVPVPRVQDAPSRHQSARFNLINSVGATAAVPMMKSAATRLRHCVSDCLHNYSRC